MGVGQVKFSHRNIRLSGTTSNEIDRLYMLQCFKSLEWTGYLFHFRQRAIHAKFHRILIMVKYVVCIHGVWKEKIYVQCCYLEFKGVTRKNEEVNFCLFHRIFQEKGQFLTSELCARALKSTLITTHKICNGICSFESILTRKCHGSFTVNSCVLLEEYNYLCMNSLCLDGINFVFFLIWIMSTSGDSSACRTSIVVDAQLVETAKKLYM